MLAVADLDENVADVGVDVDPDDLASRHHDVVHGNLLQVQDAQEHLLSLTGQADAFSHHCAKLLHAQAVSGGLLLLWQERFHDGVGNSVDENHAGIQQPEHRLEQIR